MPKTPLALSPPAKAATEKVANVATPPIYVTQPTLPPLQEFMPYLEEIWALFSAPFARGVVPTNTHAT